MRVKVDTPGVTVELECEGSTVNSLEDLAKLAMDLFHQAGGWPTDRPGTATGFSTEIAYGPPGQVDVR